MRSTIKIVILLFFICTSMSGASFPDMEKYMRQHALIWEQLPMQWNEGAFLGNGLVGMMVYADSTLNALVFHLGRPDVTDHRKAPYRKTPHLSSTKKTKKVVGYSPCWREETMQPTGKRCRAENHVPYCTCLQPMKCRLHPSLLPKP